VVMEKWRLFGSLCSYAKAFSSTTNRRSGRLGKPKRGLP
jgi:hypothetical protein